MAAVRMPRPFTIAMAGMIWYLPSRSVFATRTMYLKSGFSSFLSAIGGFPPKPRRPFFLARGEGVHARARLAPSPRGARTDLVLPRPGGHGREFAHAPTHIKGWWGSPGGRGAGL